MSGRGTRMISRSGYVEKSPSRKSLSVASWKTPFMAI